MPACGVAKGHVRARPLLLEIGFAPEMIASGDHAAYFIRPDSVSSSAMPGPAPGMGAEGADGREKPGHDEVRESSMTAYLISLALAGLIAIAVWEGFS